MKRKFKISSLLLSLTLALVIMVGCSTAGKTITDREGKEITVPDKVERIISTAPSNTEILLGLGLSEKIVAVDTYSEGIEGLKGDLPKIDFSNPNAETIISLEPDLIIASEVNTGGDNDPFKLVKEAGITVVYIPSSTSIEGIYEDITFISQISKAENEGKTLVNNMKKEIDSIKKIGESISDKKKVYFEIGSGSTLYSFGNNTFLNEMIEVIGAENIFAKESSWIIANPENILMENPDVILTSMPEFNGISPVDEIKNRSGWDSVKAVKEGKVYSIDGNTSSRASQNIIKALKEIAKAVYPDEYK